MNLDLILSVEIEKKNVFLLSPIAICFYKQKIDSDLKHKIFFSFID